MSLIINQLDIVPAPPSQGQGQQPTTPPPAPPPPPAANELERTLRRQFERLSRIRAY